MIWLQTFAFFILAGLTQAQSFHSYEDGYQARKADSGKTKDAVYELSSFPYYHIPLGLPNDDLYTSSIVSLSAGPLCSGFHISQNSVVTAASCVFRETAKNLVVISHDSKDGHLEFLPVQKLILNENYDVKSDQHNLAVLVVNKNVSHHVPTLKLPRLGATLSDSGNSDVYLAKHTFSANMMDLSTVTYPVYVSVDTRKCTSEAVDNQVFFCVSKVDQRPYSYGLADLGTPLIFKNKGGDYLGGVFTGHRYNVAKTYYLYQSVYANMEFLLPFSSS